MAEKVKIRSPPSAEVRDTEYNALRRRMSKLRVQQGHLPIADDMDMEAGDEYYNDLVRFWKKHKIYMGKEMMSTIADAKAKKKAKQKGRRRSIEFEDLDMNSAGKLALPEHMTRRSRLDSDSDTVPEDAEWTNEHKIADKSASGRIQNGDPTKKRHSSAASARKTPVARSISHSDSPRLIKKGSSSPSSNSPKSSPKILKKTFSEPSMKRNAKATKSVIEHKDSGKTVK
ncbi:hypothetical protein FSP39_012532 [Pinctada imbricata]|uniref:Uncharacterized protein n=1 Tax=Pinctada imbricata TaxID=66713 RepID=A0AA88YTX8_PINIB|nr:hypothetical protein FSP39_012532 [Pinctada imbricata]